MKTKLFLGTRLTPDLKMRLAYAQDKQWELIPFEGKEYVGIYVDTPLPTVKHIRYLCQAFMEALQKSLPDLRTDTLPIVVFPQVFLG
jgi:hypothetical protein